MSQICPCPGLMAGEKNHRNDIISMLWEKPEKLAFLREQDEELCLAAVQTDGLALRHVRRQTPEICLAAVLEDGEALEFVQEQTPALCRAAVMQNGLALRFVKKQNDDICELALKQNPDALAYVQHMTKNLLYLAVFSPTGTSFLPEGVPPDLFLDREASARTALARIEHPTQDQCLRAVTADPDALELLSEEEQTEEVCLAAVRKKGEALRHVRSQTEEVCLAAVRENGFFPKKRLKFFI